LFGALAAVAPAVAPAAVAVIAIVAFAVVIGAVYVSKKRDLAVGGPAESAVERVG
jgi:hypothetical protein